MTRDPALALGRNPVPLSSPERKGPAYWGSVHLAGDRRQPIALGDRRKRQPSGTSIGFWQRGRKEARFMNKPQRIQLSRRKGWRMPENTVSVARPGRWGNPFRILNEEGWPLITRVDGSGCFNKREHGPGAVPAGEGTNWDNVHAHAVELFRERAVDGLPDLTPLRGKNLACWCALDQPCHADVLLELANAEVPS